MAGLGSMGGEESSNSIPADVPGRFWATMARIRSLARSRWTTDKARRSPAATAVSAITLVFPNAEPRPCIASKSTVVPPSVTPGLKVR